MERSRSAVLNAVAELLADHGVAAVTIEAVVARSGAARATVYRHWPTRDALVLAGLEHLMPPPTAATGTEQPVDAALAELVHGFAAQLRSEPWAAALPVLLETVRRHPPLRERMEQFLGQRTEPARAVLRRGAASGELDPDLDVDAAVSLLLGPLVFRRLITAEPLDEPFLAGVLDGFLAAHGRSPHARDDA